MPPLTPRISRVLPAATRPFQSKVAVFSGAEVEVAEVAALMAVDAASEAAVAAAWWAWWRAA